MAYLFEFISDFFKYVYTIDFLYFMFSSVENALPLLAWIFIIIPSTLYATHSYNPKDFLGYISVALFWCVCGFLVILCPISLLLYFFYRWLCKKVSALWPKWKSRMQPWFKKVKNVLSDMLSFLLCPFLTLGMMVFVAIYAIFVDPFLSLIKWVKNKIQERRAKQSATPRHSVKPEPFSPSKDDAQQLASHFTTVNKADSSSSCNMQSSAHEVCRLIWHQTDLYIKYADPNIDRKQHMYLWSGYFYVVVKTVRDQAFVNEIYSCFEKFAISYVKDPGSRAYVVHQMKMDYREIRPALNTSGINPRDEAGRMQLWNLIRARMYPSNDFPPNAQSRFIIGALLLAAQSRNLHQRNPSIVSQPRYSICEPDETESLPDE